LSHAEERRGAFDREALERHQKKEVPCEKGQREKVLLQSVIGFCCVLIVAGGYAAHG
jgi:hypothetical protein